MIRATCLQVATGEPVLASQQFDGDLLVVFESDGSVVSSFFIQGCSSSEMFLPAGTAGIFVLIRLPPSVFWPRPCPGNSCIARFFYGFFTHPVK